MLRVQADKVIWFHTAFLGDMVLLSAAMHLLAQKQPETQQYLISSPAGTELLKHLPILKSCIPIVKNGKSLWKQTQQLLRELRAAGLNKTDSVILRAHASTRSALLCAASGFPVISHQESSLSSLSRYRVPRVAVFHEAQRLAMLLEPLGIHREDILTASPALSPAQQPFRHPQLPESVRSTHRLIGVAPGSIWGTKRWPAESFAQLICHLLKKGGRTILLLGSPAEEALTAQITASVSQYAGHSTNKDLIDLAGKTSLDDLRAIYPQLSLLISNDSSPVHFASAYGVPVLALFGATVPAMGFSPLSPHSICAEVRQLSCRPCSDHGPKRCPLHHFRCMKELNPDLVLHQCEHILSTLSEDHHGAKSDDGR